MADARIVYVRHGVPDGAATRGWGIRLRSPGEPRQLRLLPSPDGCGFEWASAREFNCEGMGLGYSASASTARLQTSGARC